MPEKRVLRWGVLGCSRISHDFVTTVGLLDTCHAQKVVAVASRQNARAEQFALEHCIDRYYGNYQQLIDDQDIDAVFVGCATWQHYEVVSDLVHEARPVLCAAPLCLSELQCRQLLTLARDAHVLVMEMCVVRCLPVFRCVRENLDRLGEVRAISCSLSDCEITHSKEAGVSARAGEQLLRVISPAVQLISSLLQLNNCDNLQLGVVGQLSDARDTNDWQRRSRVNISTCISGDDGECVASFTASTDTQLPGDALISASNHTVKLDGPFETCSQVTIMNERRNFPLPQPSDVTFRHKNSASLHYVILHAAECIRNGLKESSLMPLQDSLLCAQISEKIRRRMHVMFPQDSFHFSNHQFHFRNDYSEDEE